MAQADPDASTLAVLFRYIDVLRSSGKTNMFDDASPHLREAFPELSEEQARKVLADWMRTFAEDASPEARAEKAIAERP